jgi:hypothetical protein
MALRDWSGNRLVLTWIWSSLCLGLTEPIADAVGHPVSDMTSGLLRLALLIVLVAITWKWYRLRTQTRAQSGDPLS